MITFGNNILGVSAVDLNGHYQGKNTKSVLYNDDTVIQSISNTLFLNKDDIIYGNGDELDILNNVFSLVSDIGEDFTLIKIQEKIEAADPRVLVDIENSFIESLTDEVVLNLSVKIRGQLGNQIITRRFSA